jgi:hypothetical protein
MSSKKEETSKKTNQTKITSVSICFQIYQLVFYDASDMVKQRYQKNFSREIVWRCLDLTITRLTKNIVFIKLIKQACLGGISS